MAEALCERKIKEADQNAPLFRGGFKSEVCLLRRLLFCVPQRIGIYVGWVDVKGFLIMSALRKSTHHSKESFWWVGYCRISVQ